MNHAGVRAALEVFELTGDALDLQSSLEIIANQRSQFAPINERINLTKDAEDHIDAEERELLEQIKV